MANSTAIITKAIMEVTGRSDLSWKGLLKEVHSCHPDIKNVIAVRPALMQNYLTIVVKLYNGQKVKVSMNVVY